MTVVMVEAESVQLTRARTMLVRWVNNPSPEDIRRAAYQTELICHTRALLPSFFELTCSSAVDVDSRVSHNVRVKLKLCVNESVVELQLLFGGFTHR